MADRYVVMSIAEARASGKRASGFLSRARAESCAALLNSRPPGRPGRYASQAPRWWRVGESDTHAVVDTATTADGRDAPAVNADPWDADPPGAPLVIAGLLELHADHLRWRVCNVYGDNHAHGEGMGIGRNRKAATDAAEALLLAALEELRGGRK